MPDDLNRAFLDEIGDLDPADVDVLTHYRNIMNSSAIPIVASGTPDAIQGAEDALHYLSATAVQR